MSQIWNVYIYIYIYISKPKEFVGTSQAKQFWFWKVGDRLNKQWV